MYSVTTSYIAHVLKVLLYVGLDDDSAMEVAADALYLWTNWSYLKQFLQTHL